jgi:heptosyltransferase-2
MKILVIRYRFIGDTILTIPFLRNLRKAYPDAQIDMVVGPVSGDVLTTCPYIDNLIIFDTTRKFKYENSTNQRQSFFSYVKLLKNQKYEKAYVLKRSFSSAALAFFADIKERIGFDTENRGFLLTKKIPYITDKHEVECFLDILRADNIPVNDNYLENWIQEGAENKVINLFKELNISNNKKVLIHATSGNILKQWPLEYFAKVIEFLANQRNIQVFYTGTASDSKIYDQIHNLINTDLKIKPVNLCGKLNLQESTALINKMNFVAGSDSGTLHIAASLNIPVIGIYGPMNPVKWQAFGDIHKPIFLDMPCIPCELRKKCQNNIACLKNITPEMIINKIDQLLV